MNKYLLLVGAAMVAGGAPAPAQAATLPNIVIVYADDLGYGDLSCYNPECAYETPRLDRMAAEGVRFTDAHSPSTICSPSRYGLLSGQQIYRSTGGGGGAFEGPGGPSYLKPGTLTLGDMLRAKGYRTGVFGKWHVGLTWLDEDGKRLGGGFKNALLIDYEKSTPLVDGPNARGFDESFVTPNCPTTDPLYIYIHNGMVPSPASQRHRRSNLPNPGGKWRWDNDEGWMAPDYRFVDADLLFYDKALEFITRHREEHPEQPFFVLLATQISHAPVLPAPGFDGKTDAGPRGDFVRELDVLAGRLLDALDRLGIGDDTLVLFNSDNGPETVHTDWMRRDHGHDAAGGFRGMKRDGWEGGHRVPFLARWPGRIPAGQVSDQLTSTTDIFATLASVVGYRLPDEVATDSFDMLPAMIGTQEESESIRPHLLTQSFRGEFQVRQGTWKYLDHQGSGGNRYDQDPMKAYALAETAPGAPGQLYDLAEDPGETTNLYFTEEARRKELQQLLERLKSSGRSAPRNRSPIGVEGIPRLGRAAPREPETGRPRGREATASAKEPGAEAPGKVRFDPVVKNIEGWTVHVDPQMLAGEHADEGARALTMLANHLQRIAILLPEDRLAEVRKLEIWIEHDHPDLNVEPGPYHPSAGWLTAHGYDARLAKKVHITRAASLLERHHMVKHPAVILHELAHAYHDQILGGFDEPRIKAAYDKAMAAGLYDEVLLYTGKKVRAYAATNPMEYFAEGTEAYFYRNDFYPFVRAELAEHDPVLHDLLEEIWGPLR